MLEASGASRERGESMRGGGTSRLLEGVRRCSPGFFFFKIYVSEKAFQAILKPIFSYSITSIFSKVRHSNPRGGGGYSDTFICIRRLGLFLGGVKISIILGVFRKMNILLGMKILWMFFWGHHKIWLYLGVISMHFRVLS